MTRLVASTGAMNGHADSYWTHTAGSEPGVAQPLDGDRRVEVAVIGGGYTGLTAARQLAGTHGLETAVLEAQHIGWGASGRNGGFALVSVGKVGLEERIRKWGLAAARRSIDIGVEAVETVRNLIAVEAIACEPQADGWLVVAHRRGMVSELQERVHIYRDVMGYSDVDWLEREELNREGYLRGSAAYGAIRFRSGFGLHPLKYVRGLAAAAARRGAKLYDQSPVLTWQRNRSEHLLITPTGTLRARRVVVATNGYTPERLHPFFRGRLLPADSNIVVTRTLTEAEWKEVGMLTTQVYSDTRKLVFYWRRLPDDRLLFGGRGGVFHTEASLRYRRRWLESAIAERWPVLRGVGSDYFWHGNVCLSYDRMPHVNVVDGEPDVAYAMAYLGSGVALSSYCGSLAADLVIGKPIARDTPLTAQGLVRFPLSLLRRAYLTSAYMAYAVRDRWL